MFCPCIATHSAPVPSKDASETNTGVPVLKNRNAPSTLRLDSANASSLARNVLECTCATHPVVSSAPMTARESDNQHPKYTECNPSRGCTRVGQVYCWMSRSNGHGTMPCHAGAIAGEPPQPIQDAEQRILKQRLRSPPFVCSPGKIVVVTTATSRAR